MKKCAITTLIVFAIGTLIWFLISILRPAPADYIYQGKHVSEWVRLSIEAPPGSDQLEAKASVRAVGQDAAPFLIQVLKRKPKLTETESYKNFYAHLPTFAANRLAAPKPPDYAGFRAHLELGELGPAAKSAVPFLASEFNAHNRYLIMAATVLRKIGPEAAEAIPTLTNALNGTNMVMQQQAAMALTAVDPYNTEVPLVALSEIKSTNVVLRRFGATIMGQIKSPTGPMISALQAALNDEDPSVRTFSTNALKSAGVLADLKKSN